MQDYELSEAEIEALADGESPASMDIIDYEDLIQYLARKLVEKEREIFELMQGESL